MTESTSTAHTVLTVLTIISSILMRVSPCPDFYRVHKRQATGKVAVLPVVLLGLNCYVLAIYGFLVGNIFPLFAVSVFGILTSLGFIGVYYMWSRDRPLVRRICAAKLVVLILVTIYTILATTGVTNQSQDQVNASAGWISIVTSIGLFMSPLATVKEVVHTKSAASLPFAMCLTNMVNCMLWVVFAIIDPDMFVLIPNAAGSVLGVLQVALWLMYRPVKPMETQIIAPAVHDFEMPAHSSIAREEETPNSVIFTHFTALRSPKR